MVSAISQSGLAASDVDYLNTHGSSSALGDETEAEAISQVFGNHASDLWIMENGDKRALFLLNLCWLDSLIFTIFSVERVILNVYCLTEMVDFEFSCW